MILFVDHYKISPFAFSAFVAMTEMGIPFELKIVKLHEREQRDSPYADQSLTARVPMLVDGDFSLSESNVIWEYLEDTAKPPNSLRNALGARELARVRQMQSWMRSDLLTLRMERFPNATFYGLPVVGKELSDGAKLQRKKLERVFDATIGSLREFVAGHFTPADADLACLIQRMMSHGDTVSSDMKAYSDRIWSRPSVRAYLNLDRPAWVPYSP